MIRYRNNIIPTVSLFFKYKNDVDIFIEDSNDEEFYKALLNNLFQGKKRIGKIISCGCKTRLLSACENDQIDRDRRRVYVTDGDLDLIHDTNRNDLNYLYVLDRYCIENFIIEESGIYETLHDCIILDKDEIEKKLGLNNWLKSISNPLIELFLHYSICHNQNMGLQTVKYSVGKLCVQKRGITVLDFDKINDRIKYLRNEIVTKIGDDKYNESIYDLRQKWQCCVGTLLKIVSAKDYIIPLLEFRFKKLQGKETYNLKRETLRMRLAKTADLEFLKSLRQQIISA